MAPPRRRRRVQLSAYDRELLQAVNDRRLDRDDPEVQAVLQRLNPEPPARPAWQTPGVSVQPVPEPPPPSSFEKGGIKGAVASLLPHSYSLWTGEPMQRSEPDHPNFRRLGRDIVEHGVVPVLDELYKPVGRNPYSPAMQDWQRERGLPTDPSIRGPLGFFEGLTGAIPAVAASVYDLATGKKPQFPDLVQEPPTWQSITEERGAGKTTQAIGRMADVLFGIEDFVFPGSSAAAGVVLSTGKVLRRTARALKEAEKLIPSPLRAAKEVLTTKNWNLLLEGVEKTPGATRALSFLDLSEINPLTRSSGAVQTFMNAYNRLPDADYLAAAIRRGDPKRGWYANSRQALTDIFGDDADMFTGVLASMSPQTSVESNMTNALNVFVNWRAAGRPTSEKKIRAIMARSVQGGTEKSVLTAWTPNTVRVLQGSKSISGPKIDQFWLALRKRALKTRTGTMGPDQAMVLDAWMGHLMGADQKLWSGSLTEANAPARLATGDAGATPTYLAGVARMREAAKKVGVEGAEAQEMAWSTAMALYERASLEGISAREVLRRGLLTDEVVAGTPDFATLLRDPEFSSILNRDAELSSRIASWTPTPRAATDAITMSDTDQRHLLRVADTLDELRAMRLTDTAVETSRTPAGTLAGVLSTAAVTDQKYSSLLSFGDTTQGKRVWTSPRIAVTGENLREQQAILDAAIGGGTGSRSRGLSSRVDETGQLQENPLASYGFMGREVQGGGLPVEMERRLRAVRDIIAGGTGQSTAAHIVINPGVSRARHNAATIYTQRAPTGKAISAFAADLRALNVAGSFDPVHSGRSVRVLRLDADFNPMPLSKSEEASVRQLAARHLGTENAKGQLSAPRMQTGENVAKDGFRRIAQGAPKDSGKRVRRMVGDVSDWAGLSPAVQRRIDVEVKAWATKLQELYDMPRIRRERPDEARMLEILASSGASGLATAREAGVVLPALAVLGFDLAPSRSSGAVPQGEEA
jgi:hypothetical protein